MTHYLDNFVESETLAVNAAASNSSAKSFPTQKPGNEISKRPSKAIRRTAPDSKLSSTVSAHTLGRSFTTHVLQREDQVVRNLLKTNKPVENNFESGLSTFQ